MRFTQTLKDASKLITAGCVATIGNFDGIHLGHQALINKVVEEKKHSGLPAVVISFSPHPIFLFDPAKAPKLLMTDENKLTAIKGMGVDLSIVLPFTRALASLSPEEFVKEILVDSLAVKHLYVGHDYVFGKGRQGNAQVLTELGKKYSFTVEQIQAVWAEGDLVSSTRIRNCISNADVEGAARLMNRPYFLDGIVKYGMDRGGKVLGFPTANLSIDSDLVLPASGVYATRLLLEKPTGDEKLSPPPRALYGVTNIGQNPSFGDVPLGIETHILDFDQKIYDSPMRLWFLHHLRDEIKFSSLTALKKQIGLDAENAHRILKDSPQTI